MTYLNDLVDSFLAEYRKKADVKASVKAIVLALRDEFQEAYDYGRTDGSLNLYEHNYWQTKVNEILGGSAEDGKGAGSSISNEEQEGDLSLRNPPPDHHTSAVDKVYRVLKALSRIEDETSDPLARKIARDALKDASK